MIYAKTVQPVGRKSFSFRSALFGLDNDLPDLTLYASSSWAAAATKISSISGKKKPGQR